MRELDSKEKRMKNNFNYYKQVENPVMYLCNPNQKPLGVINGENRHLTLRFNDLSELTFIVHKINCTVDIYDKIESRRLVFVERIGWFQIKSVTNTDDGTSESKEVSCVSHQTQLNTRGFVSEERVYMFYNPNDPLDDRYDSSDSSAVPSVIGQLNKQVGIKVDLGVSKEEPEVDHDYVDWTIVYIDDNLKFKSKNDGDMYVSADDEDNICRTFSSNNYFGYDFIINEVEEAFEVIFEFDFLYHAIKVKTLNDITKPTNIYLSLDNLANSISVTEDSENIVTVLSCSGNDLGIETVNPMGTNYIVNFDYYKKEVDDSNGKKYPWMSKELIDALNEWNEVYESQKDNYSGLVIDLQKLYQTDTEKQTELTYAQLKLADLETAQGQHSSGKADGDELIVVESVDCGATSLLYTSNYYETPFSENGIIMAYKDAPTATNDDGDYVFQFSGMGKTNFVYSMLQGFVDSGEKNGDGEYDAAESSEAYLYFINDSSRKTYCKFRVAAEIGLVKDENGFLSEKGSVSVKGKSFAVDTTVSGYYFVTPEGSSQISVSKSNGSFVYNNLQFKITKSADNVVSVYCYYVAGFTRYSTYKTLTGDNNWVDIWTEKVNSIKKEKETNNKAIEEKEAEMATITNACEVQKFIKAKGDDIYNEFLNYWIEGEYTNDSIAVLDGTTMEERIELANELMEASQKELTKVSQPTFELSVSAVNFLNLIEFRQFAEELTLGAKVTIEKDEDTHYTPALVSVEYDLDDLETFELSFSNAAKLDETEMTFADLLNDASSTSRTVSANWSNLTDYWKNKEEITDLLNNPLDRSLRAGQENMSNQEFTIDPTGILGRKWADDSHAVFDREQVRIVNNQMLFTDDNWKTVRTALGKVYLDDDSYAYGLAAEVVVGNLILTPRMQIVNENGSIRLDENGIVIKNGSADVFKADVSGNLYLKGKIESTSGEIGGFTICKNALYNGLNSMSVMGTGVYVGIDGINVGGKFVVAENGVVTINEGSINIGNNFIVDQNGAVNIKKGSINLGDNFIVDVDGTLTATGATIQGEILANGGTIGGFNIDENSINNGTSSLTDNVEGVYLGTDGINVGGGFIVQKDGSALITKGAIQIGETKNDGSTLSSKITQQEIVQRYYRKWRWDNEEVTDEAYTKIQQGDIEIKRCNYADGIDDMMLIGHTVDSSTAMANSGYKIVSNNNLMIAVCDRENMSYASSTWGGIRLFHKEGSLTSSNYLDGTWYGTLGGVSSGSDRNIKNSVGSLSPEYDKLFDNLNPVRYKYNEGTSGRFHTGFIAQEVEAATINAGLSTQDFAAFIRNTDGETTTCYLRYEEIIALCVSQIQKLKTRINELEKLRN